MPLLIRGPTSQGTPSEYTLAPREAFIPEAVTATFDGSGAAGSFLPTLSVYAQSGELISRSPATSVGAGDSAEVTFAPLLRAAQSAAAGGALTKIFDSVLSAEGYFSVTGIPGSGIDLLVNVTGRINWNTTTAVLQFNGDTGAHYDTMQYETDSSFANAYQNQAGIQIGYFLGEFAGGAPAPPLNPVGMAGSASFWVPNYTGTTFQKTVIANEGYPLDPNANNFVTDNVEWGRWRDTSAITSFVLSSPNGGAPGVNDFMAGSRCTVYMLS